MRSDATKADDPQARSSCCSRSRSRECRSCGCRRRRSDSASVAGSAQDWKRPTCARRRARHRLHGRRVGAFSRGTTWRYVKLKPTSPGQRFVVRVVTAACTKVSRTSRCSSRCQKRGGRNNQGRITTRHQGGGHKRNYRVIDFRRDKDGIPGQVERLEYDPNRTAHLALVLYTDGERRYILAPKRVAVGDPIMSGVEAPIKPGNALPLKNIPLGTHRPLHRAEARQGRANCAQRGRLRADRRARRRVRHGAPALRRDAQGARRIAARRSARSATTSTTCARSARPARSVGAASARRCAASR